MTRCHDVELLTRFEIATVLDQQVGQTESFRVVTRIVPQFAEEHVNRILRHDLTAAWILGRAHTISGFLVVRIQQDGLFTGFLGFLVLALPQQEISKTHPQIVVGRIDIRVLLGDLFPQVIVAGICRNRNEIALDHIGCALRAIEILAELNSGPAEIARIVECIGISDAIRQILRIHLDQAPHALQVG